MEGSLWCFKENYALIANIAIDPKFQGHGIGGELMRFAESKARENDLLELQLATHALLKENISLYQYLGWVVTGNDEVRVLMKKELLV